MNKPISKRAAGEAATTTLQSIQALKGLLDNLTPAMRDLPAQMDAATKLISQLEIQVKSLEQAKAQLAKQQAAVQQATQTAPAQSADDATNNQAVSTRPVSNRQNNRNPAPVWMQKMWSKIQSTFGPDWEEKQMRIQEPNAVSGVRGCVDSAEDDFSKKLKKIHEQKCKDVVPNFWRKNLDYGSR